MTDPSFDELASAHLDGATTPEEATRVDADPALSARVEALRRVRDAVRAAPPVDPERRDAALAAARAAFDAVDAEADSAPAAPVRSLADVAARRRPSPTRVRQVLGAVAAVVALALLVPLLGRLEPGRDDDAATFESTGDAIEGGASDGARDESALEDAVSSTTAPGAGAASPLGAFDDLDALAEAVAADLDGGGDASGPSTAFQEEGDASCAATASSAGRVATTSAAVAGVPVVVAVTTGEGGRTLLVYRASDCALLDERDL